MIFAEASRVIYEPHSSEQKSNLGCLGNIITNGREQLISPQPECYLTELADNVLGEPVTVSETVDAGVDCHASVVDPVSPEVADGAKVVEDADHQSL